jgi:type VII secretion integral membrane protein EccD
MPATPAAIRQESCRLTVVGPDRRVDLTVPATVTLGELLPILLRHIASDSALDTAQAGTTWAVPWILQRIGEDPLDPDQTPETLDLRHGDVLYLRPAPDALPALMFDDVAVGVAGAVNARIDTWRPEFTRRLLLGAAGLALAAFALGALIVPGQPGPAVYFGVGAIVATVGSVLATRLLGESSIGLVTGLAGVVFAVGEGLTAATADHQETGQRLALSLTPSHVLLAGVSAAAVSAAVLLVSRRAPAAPYTAVLTVAIAAIAGGWLAKAAHWDAASAAGLLAVVVFMAGTLGARLVLRAVRLRVPYPPSNAEELQLDTEPEPAAGLIARTELAVNYLNGLAAGSAVVCAVAFAQLNRNPSWAGWVLSAMLGMVLLLRARILVGVWQRTSLMTAGALGLLILLISLAAHAAPEPRVILLLVLPAAAIVLLVAVRQLPGRRLLPVWGHAGDISDMVISIALVPVLLELVHAFAFFRSLAG